ncbi:HVO_2922 family protein [Halorubrum rubrum]|uniref:HVO_2922 family protein n=1 Tax=Halorubrum rubrum TaxID=1126240 RepID=A0ABD5QZS6_9EURY|nr:HVO_2922 family protein [Halorubrum rubrum]
MSEESEETVHESERSRSRQALATYFRRIARALGRGEPVPVDDAGTVTVDPPAEPDLEVEVERDGDTVSLDLQMEWVEAEGDVDTDAAASKATFEVYTDAADDWRWRLVHDNGNIIADGGEGYSDRRDAENGIESVKRNAPGAHVVDLKRVEEPPEESGSNAIFEVFEDKGGKRRWRLVHDNGNVIADGGQGYASKRNAVNGLHSVKENVPGAAVEEVDG